MSDLQRTQIIDSRGIVTHRNKKVVDTSKAKGREMNIPAAPSFPIDDPNNIAAAFKDRAKRAFDVVQWKLDNTDEGREDRKRLVDKAKALQSGLDSWADTERATGSAEAAKDNIIGIIDLLINPKGDPAELPFTVSEGEREAYDLLLKFANNEPEGKEPYVVPVAVVKTPENSIFSPEHRVEGVVKLLDRKTDLNTLNVKDLQNVADDILVRLNEAKLQQVHALLARDVPDIASFDALKSSSAGGFEIDSVTTNDGVRFAHYEPMPDDITDSIKVIADTLNEYNPDDPSNTLFTMNLR